MPWPAKRYLGTDTFRYPAPIICEGIVPFSLCRDEPLRRPWSPLVTAQVRQLRFAFAIDFSGRRGRFSIQESDEPASGRHGGRRGEVNGAVVWLCSPAHSRKSPQILPLRGSLRKQSFGHRWRTSLLPHATLSIECDSSRRAEIATPFSHVVHASIRKPSLSSASRSI